MTWSERILGAGAGALVVGIVLGALGVGPERVVTGLLTVAAAALLGAILDDLVEQRARGRWGDRRVPAPRPPDSDRLPLHEQPDEAPPPHAGPAPSRGAAARPVVAGGATSTGGVSDRAPPRPEPDPVPSARWVEARSPQAGSPSERWMRVGERDLRETIADTPTNTDLVCIACGRTVTAGGERPVECVVTDGATTPCVLRDRADRLITGLNALRDEIRTESR